MIKNIVDESEEFSIEENPNKKFIQNNIKEEKLELKHKINIDDIKSEFKDENNLWFDDPKDDLFVPHLTLLTCDPKKDEKLRNLILPKHKKQQINNNNKDKKRNKRENIKSKEDNIETFDDNNLFGYHPDLFKSLRKQYSKYTFGNELIESIEYQANFNCIQKHYLK